MGCAVADSARQSTFADVQCHVAQIPLGYADVHSSDHRQEKFGKVTFHRENVTSGAAGTISLRANPMPVHCIVSQLTPEPVRLEGPQSQNNQVESSLTEMILSPFPKSYHYNTSPVKRSQVRLLRQCFRDSRVNEEPSSAHGWLSPGGF